MNEGFATYASWLWLEHRQGPGALKAAVAQSRRMLSGSVEPPGAPNDLFGVAVYQRGALTLQALRLTIGDESFFRVLRAWADRHRYAGATTADFVSLVKELAPQVPPAQLDALFQAWLHGGKLPAMP